MEINILISFTLETLKLLYNQFLSGCIGLNELYKHSNLKLDFLEENIDSIDCFQKRKDIMNILQMYKKLFVCCDQRQ